MSTQLSKCPLCNSASLKQEYAAVSPHRYADSSETFNLDRCLSCGVAFLNPMPEGQELSKYYPSDYYTHLTFFETSTKPRLLSRIYAKTFPSSEKRRLAGKLALAREYMPIAQQHKLGRARRCLDIGTGGGEFLAALQQDGWEVAGTDFSADAARLTSARLRGAHISVGAVEQISLTEGHYDLVTFWDVLEHTSNPRVALKKACSALRPGGRIIVSVPNFASLERRIMGSSWPHLDVPRHLFHFQKKALEKLFTECDLKILECSARRRLLTEHLTRKIFPFRAAMESSTSRLGCAFRRVFDDASAILLIPWRILVRLRDAGNALVVVGEMQQKGK